MIEKEVKECAFEKEETTDGMETEVMFEVQDSSEKEHTETNENAKQVDMEIVDCDCETFWNCWKVEMEMAVEVRNSSEIEDTGTNENVNEIIETIEKVE